MNEIEKKNYIPPQMSVVEMPSQVNLLSGSGKWEKDEEAIEYDDEFE